MKWSLPSFFLMKKTSAPIRDLEGQMQLVERASSRNMSSSPCSSSVIGYTLRKPGSGSRSSSIVWSHLRQSGRLSKDSLLKTSLKLCRDSSMESQKDACLEFLVNVSASHCETVLDAHMKWWMSSGWIVATKMRSPSLISMLSLSSSLL